MRLLLALLILCLSFPALSAWQLDNSQSSLHFISTKKGDVAEVHHFEKMNGNVQPDGKVTLAIDLASVNTNIPIRDQRMRDFLFETTKFSKAVFTTDVDLGFISALPVGVQKQLTLAGNIALHGKKQAVEAKVTIAKLTKDRLLINAVKPVLLNAKQFELAAGVAKLQEIAGLPSISNSVPVTFNLLFVDK